MHKNLNPPQSLLSFRLKIINYLFLSWNFKLEKIAWFVLWKQVSRWASVCPHYLENEKGWSSWWPGVMLCGSVGHTKPLAGSYSTNLPVGRWLKYPGKNRGEEASCKWEWKETSTRCLAMECVLLFCWGKANCDFI